MALNFDQLTATTYKLYRKTLADNVMKKIALYEFMKKKGNIERKKGGIKIVEPLLYGLNSTFKSYSAYDVLDTTPQDGITAAEFDWRDLAVSVTISKQEEDQNSGETQIINLLKSKIQQAEKTYTLMFDKMLNGDGTGNFGKDLQGIKNFLSNTPTAAATVGGIDQVAYSWWQNRQDTAAVFDINGLDKMRHVFNLCTREGDQPNFLLTDQTTFEAYEGLMTNLERFNFSSPGNLHGDLGFATLTFHGQPIVWDVYAEANKIRFLNTDYLKLIVDSNTDFEMTEFRVPVNQMVKTAFILFRGQLVCNNRQLQGVLDITAYS